MCAQCVSSGAMYAVPAVAALQLYKRRFRRRRRAAAAAPVPPR